MDLTGFRTEEPPRPQRTRTVALAISAVLVVGVVVYLLLRNSGVPKSDQSGESVPAVQPTSEAPLLPAISEFKIKAEGGKFVPGELKTKRGDQIIINFTAVDGAYDFGFEDDKIGFDVIVKKGETKTFGFTAKKIGEFVFHCIQFCPRGKTMEGVLRVEP